MNPILTIITATYNPGPILIELIKSIRKQKNKNIEWIVIDGGSTDNTINLIKEAGDVVSFYCSESDSGIYDAWNKAIPKALGEWILFMGADDIINSDVSFYKLLNRLEAFPSHIYLVYGLVYKINSKTQNEILGSPWHITKSRISSYMSIPHQSVFHRRNLFKIVGLFDKQFKIAGDYEFILRSMRFGFTPQFINELVVNMGGDGISSKPLNGLIAHREFVIARLLNGMRPYTFLSIFCYAKACITLFLYTIFGHVILGFFQDLYRQVFNSKFSK